MPIQKNGMELFVFDIEHVPKLTALAASLYATMLFPTQGQEIDRFNCARAICVDWRTRYDAGSIKDVLSVVRSELLATLNFSRRFPVSKLAALQEKGSSTGNILKFVLLLDQSPDLVSSVKKAVALMVKLKPVSTRKLTSSWAEMKGVSHFWAAYNELCLRSQRVSPHWRLNVWLSFMQDPRPLLAIAGNYRNWATTHTSVGSGDARVLVAQETWSIPKQIGPLPQQNFFNPQLLYEGLSPEARGYLDRYRRNPKEN